MCDVAKLVLQGKFIALNTCIRNEKKMSRQ